MTAIPDGNARLIACGDLTGRPRQLVTIHDQHGRTMLVFPPGEVAVLPAAAVDELRALLTSAEPGSLVE